MTKTKNDTSADTLSTNDFTDDIPTKEIPAETLAEINEKWLAEIAVNARPTRDIRPPKNRKPR